MNHAIDPVEKLVEAELAQNYLGYTPATLAIHLIAAGLMLLPLHAGAAGVLWYVCYVLLNALRWLTWWGYRRAADRDSNPQRWVNRQAVGLFVSGTMWGLAPWLFMAHAPDLGKIYVFATVVVMAVGTTLVNAPFPPARLAYGVPALLLGGLRAIVEGGVQFAAIGGVLLTALPIVAYFGAYWGRLLRESIRMRHEKTALIVELTAQKAAAERANIAKSQFFAAASHDLRQPLHALGYYAALLDDPARAPQVAPQVQACVQALDDLFDGILGLARLDAGAVEPQRRDFTFAEMSVRLRTVHLPLLNEKKLKLHWRIDEALVGYSDPLLIERILGNLLSNAVRYTTRGGVLVAVRARGGGVVVTVCDTGRGLSELELARAFDEFVQFDNAARDAARGVGLGLPTVRCLVDLLGHELRTRSRPGRGSCFELRLPTGGRVEVPVVTSEPSHLPMFIGRALLLDDHAPSRDSFAQMLARWNINCDTAATFDEAQRLRASTHYDAIFTDFRLPGDDDGLTIVRRWETDLPAPRLLCVISGEANVPTNLPAGIDWLRKPLKPARLRALLISRLCMPSRA
jgi:two-component system, sensor histidine kinase